MRFLTPEHSSSILFHPSFSNSCHLRPERIYLCVSEATSGYDNWILPFWRLRGWDRDTHHGGRKGEGYSFPRLSLRPSSAVKLQQAPDCWGTWDVLLRGWHTLDLCCPWCHALTLETGREAVLWTASSEPLLLSLSCSGEQIGHVGAFTHLHCSVFPWPKAGQKFYIEKWWLGLVIN